MHLFPPPLEWTLAASQLLIWTGVFKQREEAAGLLQMGHIAKPLVSSSHSAMKFPDSPSLNCSLSLNYLAQLLRENFTPTVHYP